MKHAGSRTLANFQLYALCTVTGRLVFAADGNGVLGVDVDLVERTYINFSDS